MPQGKRNSYVCDICLGTIITVDQDQGTTPFMLACRALKACPGMMRSTLYRGSAAAYSTIRPHYVWRKPTSAEYDKSSTSMKQHFDRGGLDIFPYPEVKP